MKSDKHKAPPPMTISLAEACRRVGICVRTAEKVPDFPPIITLGGKRVVGRNRFESWAHDKFGPEK